MMFLITRSLLLYASENWFWQKTYIGLTTTTLSCCLTMHLASVGPKQHALTNHHMPLTTEELVNNIQIIFSESNNNKLSITEALLIQKMQSSINSQSTGISRTLKLFTCPLPTVPDPNLKSNIKFIYPFLNYHANCTSVIFYIN